MVSGSILAVWAPDEGNRGDELPRMGKREPCHLLGRYCARALGSAGREMSRLRSRGSVAQKPTQADSGAEVETADAGEPQIEQYALNVRVSE